MKDDALPGWQRYDEPNTFVVRNGPIWLRRVDGARDYAFRVGPDHLNINGIVHGGMISTFADHALGHACFLESGERKGATVHLSVAFVSGARDGELVTGRVVFVRKTRSLYFARCDVVVGDRMIATADMVWKILDPLTDAAA